MTWLLIDADMELFTAVKACEAEIEWMPDVITTHTNIREVKFLVDTSSELFYFTRSTSTS